MHNSVMPYGHLIADISRTFLVCTVNNGTILYVDFISHFDIMDITPGNGVKPKTTPVSANHISDNRSVFRNITVLSKLRFSTVNFFNQGFHISALYSNLAEITKK